MSKQKKRLITLSGKPFKKKKPSLMLGRPIARVPEWENQVMFMRGFYDLSQRGYRTNWEDMESMDWWMKHHSSSRNAICRRFMERDDDYLIFIDDDMTFHSLADDIEKMIALDKDMVMAICCCKPAPHFPHLGKFIEIGKSGCISDSMQVHVYEFPEDKPFETDGGSASLLCIKRKVIEKVKPPWFYFPPNHRTNNVWSEDITFMFNLKMWGFEIWCDPTIDVGHLGITAWNYKTRSTHYNDFKKDLIKQSKDNGINPDHHLVPEVQAIFKKGLGPKAFCV